MRLAPATQPSPLLQFRVLTYALFTDSCKCSTSLTPGKCGVNGAWERKQPIRLLPPVAVADAVPEMPIESPDNMPELPEPIPAKAETPTIGLGVLGQNGGFRGTAYDRAAEAFSAHLLGLASYYPAMPLLLLFALWVRMVVYTVGGIVFLIAKTLRFVFAAPDTPIPAPSTPSRGCR
jgi:hypothetical protein